MRRLNDIIRNNIWRIRRIYRRLRKTCRRRNTVLNTRLLIISIHRVRTWCETARVDRYRCRTCRWSCPVCTLRGVCVASASRRVKRKNPCWRCVDRRRSRWTCDAPGDREPNPVCRSAGKEDFIKFENVQYIDVPTFAALQCYTLIIMSHDMLYNLTRCGCIWSSRSVNSSVVTFQGILCVFYPFPTGKIVLGTYSLILLLCLKSIGWENHYTQEPRVKRELIIRNYFLRRKP